MNPITHNLEPYIEDDLNNKMVFLSGPRQVGKTTLSKKITKKRNGKYLLYDNPDDKDLILNKLYLNESLVCLDEFHKYARWKSYLKGVYDKHKDTLNFIITGSARLDVYQQAGDSLFGRYYLHQLFPLTLAELHNTGIRLPTAISEPENALNGLKELMTLGGFPEPFLKGSEQFIRRWSNQRRQLLIHEDLRELSDIKLLSVAEALMSLLPHKVCSLISYQSIANHLQISVPTVQDWLKQFERLFIVFKISPYTAQLSRSIQKAPKYYLWDWSLIENEGAKFENLIALHLLKAVTNWTNLGLANCSLHFLRDKNSREVDFLIVKNNKPWFLVETKLSDDSNNDTLHYYCKKLAIPGILLLQKDGIYKQSAYLTTISANTWLGKLA
jgi:predicted AAA+ superfamily ATPase